MRQSKGGAHRAKKPRNKAYTPKPALFGGGLQALVRIEDRARVRTINNSTYKQEDLTELGTAYWGSFGDITTGAAREDSWHYVAGSLNMALLLCEAGLGEEHTPLIIAAQDGIFKAKLRGERTGSYRLDGAGIMAVREALHVHDAQMAHATPNDIAAADAELKKRIAAGDVYSAEQMH